MEGKLFAMQGAHAEQRGQLLNGGQGIAFETRIPSPVADQLYPTRWKTGRHRTCVVRELGSAQPHKRINGWYSGVAMIEEITEPVANAVVTWVTPEMGGRSSGPPPSGPVYAATSVFVHGGDAEVQPGWPVGADQLSILVQATDTLPGGAWLCKVDFLARDLVRPCIHPGTAMLVMEGPRVVATAVITAVVDPERESAHAEGWQLQRWRLG